MTPPGVAGDLSHREIVRLLDLRPHPEGGHFREVWRDAPGPDGRALSTAIYFLLGVDEFSAWHRIDAAEMWHFYAGAPLSLTISPDGVAARSMILSDNLRAGHRPQAVVPANAWQTATSLGAWSLVGCTVVPGFDFARLELAPADWRPG